MVLIVLAQPILSVLFERGAFGPTETEATAAALAAYASGLPAFVLVKVLAPGFYAHRNTATPVRVAVAALALNLGLTIVLMQFLAHVGVAIALSVAGWMQALALLVLLARHGHFRLDRRARSKLPRIPSLTEREAPRGSKSGMRLSSPRVRGFECPEDCVDVPIIIGPCSASWPGQLAPQLI